MPNPSMILLVRECLGGLLFTLRHQKRLFFLLDPFHRLQPVKARGGVGQREYPGMLMRLHLHLRVSPKFFSPVAPSK